MSHSFENGFSRAKRKTMEPSMYWGDGHDGILTEGKMLQAGVDFTQYEDFAVLEYERIHWDPVEPEMLTVDQPCRGLVMFVQGDVYIGQKATISMAKMGSILPCNPGELLVRFGTSKKMRHIVDRLKTLRGGAGGDGGEGGDNGGTGGLGGIHGEGRICQGGRGAGGGGGCRYGTGGKGGDVIYPEVMGYGGKGFVSGSVGPAGFNGGGGTGAANDLDSAYGTGGIPFGAGSGGGGGKSGSTNGGDGEHTGGFIMIIANGTVTISGTMDVTGGNGGDGGLGNSNGGGGGGGAGGGVIAVFTRGTINTIEATKLLLGGSGGAAPGAEALPGTAGQPGIYYEEKI